MDDELRALGHAARAEVEADVDTEEAWAALGRDPVRFAAPGDPVPGGTPWGWIGAAAAIVAAFAVGVLLVRGGDDDSIQSAEPPTGATAPDAAGASSTTTTTSPAATTLPAATSPEGDGATATTITDTSTSTTSAPDPTTTVPGESPAALAWRDFPWEASPIRRACVDDGRCTQLRVGPDGVVVSFDPSSRELMRHVLPPVSYVVPAAFGEYVWFELVGPDDVVYLNVDPLQPDGDGLAADLVALTLADGDVGREIGRWPGVADRIGDRDLVATDDGIVVVNCCGPDEVRPDPAAEVVVRWVDRAGGNVVADAPDVSVEIGYPSFTFVRDDLRWTVESFDGGRGMPTVVPTFDGGVIAVLDGTGGGASTIVRGWPDGNVEQIRLDVGGEGAFVELVDPTGVAVVENGDRFARVMPFDDRSDYWTGSVDIDPEAGSVAFPGLDEQLDSAAPAWAFDPVRFANAVAGPTAVNESRTIEVVPVDSTRWTAIVTTTGFFDDSVAGTRYELDLAPTKGDGSLRIEDARWTNACQPGRGHQDFSPELCA